jgi:hypothetical protein
VTSNRSVTRVLSLFTFCPPGPLEREKLSEISLSGIDRLESIITIFSSTHQDWFISSEEYIMTEPEGKSNIR